VSDGINWTNTTYSFRTTGGCPWVVIVYPTNATGGIPLTPTVQVWAYDECSLPLNLFFYENSTGSWVERQANITITANTSHNWTFSEASAYSTRYYFNVSVSNAYCNESHIFWFVTSPEVPEILITWHYPGNNTNNVCPNNLTVGVTIENTKGFGMNITWYMWTGVLFTNYHSRLDNVSNGTYYLYWSYYSYVSIYNYTYPWRVRIDDYTNGSITNTSEYWFTTASSPGNCSFTDTRSSETWIVGVAAALSVFGIIAFIKRRKR